MAVIKTREQEQLCKKLQIQVTPTMKNNLCKFGFTVKIYGASNCVENDFQVRLASKKMAIV